MVVLIVVIEIHYSYIHVIVEIVIVELKEVRGLVSH